MQGLRDYGFKDQITRSSLSIPSNIAEGMTRNSHKEKIHFLSIAKGSCSELRTQIYIGQKIQYIDEDQANKWIDDTKRIASMIFGLKNKIQKDYM
jgi:four helix bundle protein